MLTYRRETIAAIKDEIQPLLAAHWREIALDQDTIKLDPDWDAYHMLESAGIVYCITARHQGELVGYVVYLVVRNLHYKSIRVAENDLYFLDPAFRKGMAGVNLFRAAETILRGEGVDKIVNKVKISHDVGRIFEMLGYTPIERVYVKTLGG